MADKAANTKPEVLVVEEKLKDEKVKDKKEKEVIKEVKAENGDKVENGDDVDDKKSENGKEEKCEQKEEKDKCCIKRKSVGSGDAPNETPAEGASPEKKAKLVEAPAEDKEEVEAAA